MYLIWMENDFVTIYFQLLTRSNGITFIIRNFYNSEGLSTIDVGRPATFLFSFFNCLITQQLEHMILKSNLILHKLV